MYTAPKMVFIFRIKNTKLHDKVEIGISGIIFPFNSSELPSQCWILVLLDDARSYCGHKIGAEELV